MVVGVCCYSLTQRNTTAPSALSPVQTMLYCGFRAKEIKNAPVVEAPVEVNYKYLFEKSTQECEALKKRCQTLELQAAESDSRVSQPCAALASCT